MRLTWTSNIEFGIDVDAQSAAAMRPASRSLLARLTSRESVAERRVVGEGRELAQALEIADPAVGDARR